MSRSLPFARMRLLAFMASVLVCALLAAGCNGDESSGGALESSLAYVPPDTPFAVAIDTDVEGDQYQALDDVLGRFPNGDSLGRMLQGQIEQGADGVSYEDDVRPLLGNPFVVSATDPASFIDESEDDDFVAAIQVADTDALDGLIEKTEAREDGEVAGATVYEDEGTVFAVEDDMVVIGGTRDLLEAALERADGDDHLDVDTFERSLEGLPEQALARIYVDLQSLLEQDPETEAARQVQWISALRTFGMTASAADDAVEVEFNLRTDSGELSEEDLPLAAGDEAAQVVRIPGEVGFGLRDPSQVIAFFESTFQTIDPAGFGEYQTGKQAISQLGTGLGVTDVAPRGNLFEARLEDGGRFVFGVRDGVFVAGRDAARAGAMASREPEDASGAEGSLVMSADAEQVALQVLRQVAPELGLGGIFGGGLFARPLDELNGSVATSTDGMRGSVSLTGD